MDLARLTYTPVGGSLSNLDLEIDSLRGAAEPDDLEMFPPESVVTLLDGSLREQNGGLRRKIDLGLSVITSHADRVRLVSWWADKNRLLVCLMPKVTTVTVAQYTGGSLANGTYYYEIRAIDAVGGGIASTDGANDDSEASKHIMQVACDAVSEARCYAIYRKKDSGNWFLHDYSNVNSYDDDGTVTSIRDLGAGISPPSAASAISVIRGSNRLQSVFEDGYEGTRSYDIPLDEATIFTDGYFPV
jgi:hypothetical protein